MEAGAWGDIVLGGGDVGKTTILDAIALLLSPPTRRRCPIPIITIEILKPVFPSRLFFPSQPMPECTAIGHRLVGQSLDARLDPKKLLGLTQSIVSIGNWPRRILSQSAESLRSRRCAKSEFSTGLCLRRGVRGRFSRAKVDPMRASGAA